MGASLMFGEKHFNFSHNTPKLRTTKNLASLHTIQQPKKKQLN